MSQTGKTEETEAQTFWTPENEVMHSEMSFEHRNEVMHLLQANCDRQDRNEVMVPRNEVMA